MRIVVHADDGTETDVTEAVQITYDCVRNSMDWGSGFLDTVEIANVILLARAAGFPDFEDAVREVWAQRRTQEWNDEIRKRGYRPDVANSLYERTRKGPTAEERADLIAEMEALTAL